MKDFILCQNKQADIPFSPVPGLDPVFSLEELCFFMHGHLFLLEEAFFSDDLIIWIQDQLKLTGLASSLRDMKAAGKAPSELTEKIFSYSGIYDREELNELHHMIISLQDKSAVERQIIYADYLLSQKNYREALSVSLDLRKDGRFMQMTEDLQKRTIYHTGVIYARFLLLSEAKDQFLELYQKYEDERGLQAYLMLRAIADKEQIAFAEDESIVPEEEELEALSDRLDTMAKDPAFQTARDNAKEVLASRISKDAWIGMLLKKYTLVDSL
ncbi:MAG: hypothetical protein IJ108_04055 [Eubacterium sp.]|nr:hypothetical protein [Eubacterium sp.]